MAVREGGKNTECDAAGLAFVAFILGVCAGFIAACLMGLVF